MNHIFDTCPLTKFEGGLKLLHEADDDSHVAGINSDHSTRKMKRTSLMTYNRPFWRHALEYEGIMFVLSTAETRRL